MFNQILYSLPVLCTFIETLNFIRKITFNLWFRSIKNEFRHTIFHPSNGMRVSIQIKRNCTYGITFISMLYGIFTLRQIRDIPIVVTYMCAFWKCVRDSYSRWQLRMVAIVSSNSDFFNRVT